MNIIRIPPHSTTSCFSIGRRGENGVTKVEFDFSEWVEEFGVGVVSLLVKRPTDSSAYPVIVTLEGNTAVWMVSSTDTAFKGNGKAEFVYTVNEQIAKTRVFSTQIMEDIGEPSPTPPDPYETWLDTLVGSANDVEQDASDADAAKIAAETAQGKAEDAQTAAETAQDAIEQDLAAFTAPTATATTLIPGSQATADYSNGVFTFGIPQGAKGADGTTFTPSVSSEGVISWTNNGGKTNPLPVDLAAAVEGVFVVNVSGTTPSITGVANTRYICGEVSTISITPPNSGIIDVIFTSGATAATLTLPNTVMMPEWFEVEANTVYEINIADGVYGSVMSWPVT